MGLICNSAKERGSYTRRYGCVKQTHALHMPGRWLCCSVFVSWKRCRALAALACARLEARCRVMYRPHQHFWPLLGQTPLHRLQMWYECASTFGSNSTAARVCDLIPKCTTELSSEP